MRPDITFGVGGCARCTTGCKDFISMVGGIFQLRPVPFLSILPFLCSSFSPDTDSLGTLGSATHLHNARNMKRTGTRPSASLTQLERAYHPASEQDRSTDHGPDSSASPARQQCRTFTTTHLTYVVASPDRICIRDSRRVPSGLCIARPHTCAHPYRTHTHETLVSLALICFHPPTSASVPDRRHAPWARATRRRCRGGRARPPSPRSSPR